MKIKCYNIESAIVAYLMRRQQQRENWHPYFAWRPVKIDADDCRWLETVERRIISHYNHHIGGRITQYRLPKTLEYNPIP